MGWVRQGNAALRLSGQEAEGAARAAVQGKVRGLTARARARARVRVRVRVGS